MAVQSTSLETINDFLAQKRIAMVGISREPKSFSTYLFRELVRRGYDVVPVNPHAPEVLGRRCFARVQDIQPPVSAAILMSLPEITEKVVRDCVEAGIRRVWMYRAGGTGAVSENGVVFCRERGVAVVAGECPLMFLPHAGFHRVHGFIRKISGRYPQSRAA